MRKKISEIVIEEHNEYAVREDDTGEKIKEEVERRLSILESERKGC